VCSRQMRGRFRAAGLGTCRPKPKIDRNTELAKPAAAEMSSTCAIHGDVRAAELKKLKEQTGRKRHAEAILTPTL
jgi:hypothetical protein